MTRNEIADGLREMRDAHIRTRTWTSTSPNATLILAALRVIEAGGVAEGEQNKDAARLDWLEKHGCVHADVMWGEEDSAFEWCWSEGEPTAGHFRNTMPLRHAIDAAITLRPVPLDVRA